MSLTFGSCPVLAALVLTGLVACAPQDAGPAAAPAAQSSSATSPSSSSSANPCTKDQLPVKTAGTFTVGTDTPAYEPWFADNKPANGKGYESAVAYAVAKQLGFAAAEVKWITVPFANAYAPGDKKFDVDINQVTITEARRKAVDFSSGYYDAAQTVVTVKESPIAGAKSIADLKDAKLAAQVGTTSYAAINDQIKPSKKAAVYDTNDLAVQALKNGQVDGVVVDLPTAFFVAAAQLDAGVIVGQLPPGSGKLEQFGMVLAKGSPLTACVSSAVDTLRNNGTLKKLETQWLAKSGGAPVLS